MIAGTELNGDVLVADYSTGLDRGDRVGVDLDSLIYSQCNSRAIILDPDIHDFADLHAGQLNLIAGLQS